MHDIHEELLKIVEETKQLHTRDRSITLESVSLIGELERRINIGNVPKRHD